MFVEEPLAETGKQLYSFQFHGPLGITKNN